VPRQTLTASSCAAAGSAALAPVQVTSGVAAGDCAATSPVVVTADVDDLPPGWSATVCLPVVVRVVADMYPQDNSWQLVRVRNNQVLLSVAGSR
jgi:hypothetical protein